MPWVTIDGAHILIGEDAGDAGKSRLRADRRRDRQAASQTGRRKPVAHVLTASEKADRLAKGKPLTGLSDKARLAQISQTKTGKEEQDYCKPMEAKLAARLGGKAYPDNGPTDVETKYGGKTKGTELKTLVQGKNDRINMKPTALARKYEWEKANKSKMETVILDHRDRFSGGKNAALYSGHEIYYKRGLGNLRIGSMYKVKDDAELKRLQATPYKQLPKKAQGIMVGHERGWL